MMETLNNSSYSDQRVLVGNTMHMPTMVTWMFYVLGNLRFRSECCTLSPQPSSRPTAETHYNVDDLEEDKVL